MAGVSQTTVSLVLNGRAERRGPDRAGDPRPRAAGDQGDRLRGRPGRPAAGRPAQPDPRRLHLRAGLPQPRAPTSTTRSWSASRSAPRRLGCDLLLFTSAPVVQTGGGGSSTRRTGFGWPTAASCSAARRPRRAGPAGDRADSRSSRSGRRDDAGGPVPYVGADYARRRSARSSSGPAALGPPAPGLPGHRRRRGVLRATGCAASPRRRPTTGAEGLHLTLGRPGCSTAGVTGRLRRGATPTAVAIARAARGARRWTCPRDLSVADARRAHRAGAHRHRLHRLPHPPARDGPQGRRAADRVLEARPAPTGLLPCELVEGSTP